MKLKLIDSKGGIADLCLRALETLQCPLHPSFFFGSANKCLEKVRNLADAGVRPVHFSPIRDYEKSDSDIQKDGGVCALTYWESSEALQRHRSHMMQGHTTMMNPRQAMTAISAWMRRARLSELKYSFPKTCPKN